MHVLDALASRARPRSKPNRREGLGGCSFFVWGSRKRTQHEIELEAFRREKFWKLLCSLNKQPPRAMLILGGGSWWDCFSSRSHLDRQGWRCHAIKGNQTALFNRGRIDRLTFSGQDNRTSRQCLGAETNRRSMIAGCPRCPAGCRCNMTTGPI